MENKKSGFRTLLLSVLTSIPGPLITGLGLLIGRSSTQIADFMRRSAEFLAIALSFVLYPITADFSNKTLKDKLERYCKAFVGAMMCLGGTLMIFLAFFSGNEDKGNVIPTLALAAIGVFANTAFWLKYARLNKKEPNAILQAQARLYRAKSLADTCVTTVLLTVVIAPGSPVAYWLDFGGSLVVAAYLLFNGGKTILETLKKTA